MKVLVDTNVILDVLCKREGLVEHSEKVLRLCEVKKISGFISALSIPNIVYILRYELDMEKTRNLIDILTQIFEVISLEKRDIKTALTLNVRDYEDALQISSAKKINADYIISNNIKII